MLIAQKYATLFSRHLNMYDGLKRPKLYCFKCTQQLHHQSPFHYSLILKTINSPTHISQLHAQIITCGVYANNVSLSNNLMNAYISIGQISNAQKVFDEIPEKNLVSWTILVSGLTKRGLFDQALEYFCEMVESGLLPNEFSISSILPAIANVGTLLMGKSVHCYWVRQGFVHNVVVETSLVDMYAQFGCMRIAQKVFDEMPVRNLVSWNIIISGYANCGMCDDALYLFQLMQKNGVYLDCYTIMSLILASSGPSEGKISSMIHGFIIRLGFNKERQIQTALIDMYIIGDFVDEAYGVFDEMVVKDMVALTLMLQAFTYGRHLEKSFEILRELMSVHHMSIDSTAFVSVLSCFGYSRALPLGKLIHGLIIKRGFSNDVFVGSALIGMYSNCADLDTAKKCFTGMDMKDVICWNALIRAMGVNGNGREAVDLLFRMEILGIIPNESTYVSVLSACSHAGMIDDGLEIFYHMVKKRGIVPNLQHYACLVDLLGRSGRLNEAHFVISQLPLQQHSDIYNALLSACRVYGNTEVAADIYQQLLKLDLTDVGNLCMILNLHSSVGDWEGKMSHIEQRSKRLVKEPGYSVIE